MLIKQISIFLSNRKGNLERVTKLFLDHDIDVRALVAFDTADYGILRAIVTEPDRAVPLLKENGFVAKISKVIVVEPEDRTGSLYELFSTLAHNDFNIDYTYSFVMKKGYMPYFVLKTNDMQKAAELLAQEGVRVVNMTEIAEKS